MRRILLVASLTALTAACASTDAGTPAPTANNGYVYKYLGASSALDYATTAWRAAITNLASSGADSLAAEAPIDITYANALGTFNDTLLSVRFPSPAEADVHGLVGVVTAVQGDLTALATGRGSTSQFEADEATLQAAINIVQTDLSLATSTP
jgi:hypothetical protein